MSAGIDGRPLRGQLSPTLKAPFRIIPGDGFADFFVADIFKQTTPNHLTDFRLVIRYQVLGYPANHLGDPVLPLHIPIGHRNLTAGEADDRRTVRGSRRGNGQIL